MSLLTKLSMNNFNFLSKTLLKQVFTRNISVSPISRLKEIKYSENENTITVEALKVKSDRTDKLVATNGSNKECCPLCRLNLRRLDYTDVLILNQFVESNGKLMPQKITGLCTRMHQKVFSLVRKAQRCQLMPRPPDYKSYGPWEHLNTYYEWPQRVRDQPIKLVEPKYWAPDYNQNKL